VPWMAHAGLALSIGLGACVNALWLWHGLRRRGHYVPAPGWWRFLGQVLLACTVLAAWLLWVASAQDWVALRAQPWQRLGLMTGVLAVSALLYFGVLRLAGLKWRALMRV